MSAPRARPFLVGAGLVLAVVAAYAPALGADFFWEDHDYITNEEALRSLDGLRRIWLEPGATVQYYPLVFTLFWLQLRLWGLDPFGFHLVDVLVHAGATVLLWRLLERVGFPRPDLPPTPDAPRWPAVAAALAFGLHPVGVESAAWVMETKNTLSLLLALGAMHAYVRFEPALAHEGAPDAPRPWRAWALALALYALALTSKTVAAPVPAVLLLLVWWRRGALSRREVVPLLPFFAVGLGLSAVTVWVEKAFVGAVGAEWDLGLAARVLIAGRAVWFYAWKLVWPVGLCFNYPRWEVDPGVWWQHAFPLAAAGLALALVALRRRLGRGPLVAVLVYGGVLLPALGFIDVYPFRYTWVMDHFQYHASPALLALLVAAWVAWLRGLPPRARGAAVAAGWAALLTLGVLTARRCVVWRTPESLWRDTAERNPGAFLAHFNLGTLLAARGDLAEAEARIRRAIEVGPEDPVMLNALGNVLGVQGRHAEAAAVFERVRALRPDDAAAGYNLGFVLLRAGDLPRAEAALRHAVAVDPRHARARHQLALALCRAGRDDEARALLDEALARDPSDGAARVLLAWLLATHPDPARRDPARATALVAGLAADAAPRAHDVAGAVHAAAGRFEAAVESAERALAGARSVGDGALAREVEARLEGYRARRAFTAPPASVPLDP